MASEVQGFLGESSELFFTRLCKMLCCSHDDQRAGSFLKQRISGQGNFVTSHFGDNMASVTWATTVSSEWVDQIDELPDIFEEVSIFGVYAFDLIAWV